MDELSPIFQDIEFRVTLRGYDVDQVDAYIDRVAKAAALVQGRLGELQARTDAAEARLTTADQSDPEASLSRTLILAQRTADAAVTEAREEAARILAEAHEARSLLTTELEADTAAARRAADDYASRVRAEADTDRRRLLADAEAAAAAAATDERDRLAAEVAELEQYRAFLNEDVAILETHLLDQRAALAASVSALTDLVQSPEGFRVSPVPKTSGALLDLSDTATIEPPPSIEPEPVSGPETERETEPEADVALAPPSPDQVSFDAWAEPVAIDLTVAPEPEPDLHRQAEFEPKADLEPSTFFEDFERTGEFAVVDTTLPPPETETETETGSVEVGETLAVAAPPVLATVADFDVEQSQIEPTPANPDVLLFEEPAEVSAVDPFLQQIREAAAGAESAEGGDDALAAFFAQDDVDGERGWFGRRR